MPHFALVTHCSTNYCSSEFALTKSAWKSYTYNILYYNIEPSKKADRWIISPGLLGRWSACIQASDVLNQASRLWALFIDWTKITGWLPFQLPHWPSPESESGWVSITWKTLTILSSRFGQLNHLQLTINGKTSMKFWKRPHLKSLFVRCLQNPQSLLPLSITALYHCLYLVCSGDVNILYEIQYILYIIALLSIDQATEYYCMTYILCLRLVCTGDVKMLYETCIVYTCSILFNIYSACA